MGGDFFLMKLDLLTIGEVLVDLTQTGTDERGIVLPPMPQSRRQNSAQKPVLQAV